MTKSTTKKGGAKKPAVKKPVKRTGKPAARRGLQATLGRLKADQTLVGRLFLGIAVIVALSYVLGVYAAFTTSLIPGKYLGIGFLLSFVFTIGVVYALTKRGPAAPYSRLVVVVALVGIVVNVVVFSAGTSTRNFINSLHQTDGQNYTDYAIVALKKNAVSLTAPNQAVNVLQTDNTPDMQTALQQHTPARIQPMPTPTDSILGLQDGRAQMAVLTVAYLDDLREQSNNALYLELEILATFRVKVPASTTTKTNVDEPFAVYISGLDTYGAITTTSRSDVNILAVINPKSHTILFVNTPRDYYVQLHGTTGVKDKLTHAGLYGIDQSQKTLEDLYGIPINYNVKINFTSLEKIVDTLGGIEVESEYNFSSGGYSFVQGMNQLNGKQALAFSRERYSFEGGDRTRGQNQMRVLTALVQKLSKPSVVVNYQQILQALSGVFQTNMPTSDLTSLVRRQLDSLATWQVTSMSVDGTGASLPTYSAGSQRLYVMIPDETSLNSAKNKINSVLH